jgi:hypothetical protein
MPSDPLLRLVRTVAAFDAKTSSLRFLGEDRTTPEELTAAVRTAAADLTTVADMLAASRLQNSESTTLSWRIRREPMPAGELRVRTLAEEVGICGIEHRIRPAGELQSRGWGTSTWDEHSVFPVRVEQGLPSDIADLVWAIKDLRYLLHEELARQRLDDAVDTYRKVLENEAAAPSIDRAVSQNNLALALDRLSRQQEAERELTSAHETFVRMGDEERAKVATRNLDRVQGNGFYRGPEDVATFQAR